MKAFFDDTLAMFTALAAMVALSAIAYGLSVLVSPPPTFTAGDALKVGLCFMVALALGGSALWSWRQWKVNP